MADIMLDQPVNDIQGNLHTHFVLAGIITLLLIVLIVSLAQYKLSRSAIVNSVSAVLVEHISGEFKSPRLPFDERPISQNSLAQISQKQMESSAIALMDSHKLNNLLVVTRAQEVVWQSESAPISFPADEKMKMVSLLSGAVNYHVQDYDFSKFSSWQKALKNEANDVVIWTSIVNAQGVKDFLLRTSVDFSVPFAQARRLAFRILVMMLLSSLILFFVLSVFFRRGVATINSQEQKMGHQIRRLSNLLLLNKSMQNSMKTASARAVELNEQFLRRVGADLHDGPAQMIGYSVLRLNQVSQREQARNLGQEFHAVKEALEGSLHEIRGICSGLVLPELAELNIEQCLRKVVALHATKSNTEVAQYYSHLPEDIPLPIKITAYRFVQEGLNNAEDHGKANQCRLSAHVVDKTLTVSLKDNGIGFRKSKLVSASEGGHLGLVGLRDRIESLGGKLSINSELGVGTALKFTIDVADDF